MVQICENSIRAVKDSLRYSYNGTDRYFCTVYLSGLIKPISLVVKNDKIAHELQLSARECWSQVISLLRNISQNFALGRTSLQRLEDFINATNSVLGPQQNPTHLDGNAYLAETINANRPDSSASHENTLSWLCAGEDPKRTYGMTATDSLNPLEPQPHANDLSMRFPLSHMPTPAPEGDQFMGDAILDPAQWMTITW